MKLSFSTRGWKELPWPEQVKDASELRFQGIRSTICINALP